MNKFLRHLCASAPVAIALSLGTSNLLAQDVFPSRPVKIVVAYTAGTGGDILARIIGNAMSPVLGQPVIVENRAGAGGMVGTEFGANAPADGYTLTQATAGTLFIIPAIYSTAKYSEKDFVAIGGLARTSYLVVTASTPEAPKTFQELVSRLKEKVGTFGSPGAGTTTHLAGENVLRQAGVKATHVPYRGSAQMLTDVASGQVMFGFDTVGGALQLVKGGRLRALAVTTSDRVPSLPDVPTVAESGVTGLNIIGWWGLVAPAATPPDIVKKLSDALIRTLESPDVLAKLALQVVEPFPLRSEPYGNLIRKEGPTWVDLVKENKLTAN